jgi:hypothetical protein
VVRAVDSDGWVDDLSQNKNHIDSSERISERGIIPQRRPDATHALRFISLGDSRLRVHARSIRTRAQRLVNRWPIGVSTVRLFQGSPVENVRWRRVRVG